MLLLLLGGCISPQSIRMEKENSAQRHCFAYRMPEEWSFDEPREEERIAGADRRGFAIRKLEGEFLVRGRRGGGGARARWSHQIFVIRANGGTRAAENREWEKASAEELEPSLVESAAGDVIGQRRGVEFFRRSPDGRRRVVARHELATGLLAPKAIFTVQVLQGEEEKVVWTASGSAPYLPPLDQLAGLRWLDESTVMWPGNRHGTSLFVCWAIPEEEN